MNRIYTCICAFFICLSISAQMVNPVHWTFALDMGSDGKSDPVIVMSAAIDHGWHMYSHDIDPEIGPVPTSVIWDKTEGCRPVGQLSADKAPHKEFDDMFGANLSWWTDKVTLRQPLKLDGGPFSIEGRIRFSACNNENCIPPTSESFSFSGTAPRPKQATTAVTDEENAADTDSVSSAVDRRVLAPADNASAPAVSSDALWEPVKYDSANSPDDFTSSSLWTIFLTCFLFGFVALLTPCVWPMIPLTVSFFLKKSRAKAVTDAIIYALSIIIIYLILGLIVTSVFSPNKLQELSTSAVCNIIFFALLVVFAISFFGAFDISLPSSWGTRIDSKAERTTGLMSIFFMAFTLTLVSFSCTGPIIGTLLVETATSGNKLGPAIGMLGFALALAIPFCLFALFPSWLKTAPKSGAWMNTVKVVLGFIELALSLKFLSVADLAYGWHILDREVFLALWIVIFALLGAYLMGWFNFSHYGPADSSVGVTRFFLACASFAFTIYLVPGLWGAPLKGTSAFVPPLYTQDFNLYGHEISEYSDYETGMKAGAAEHKPVLIDFSGFGCVNCRKMEGAVLDQPDIRDMIASEFVMIKLMTDEKRALPSPITVEENGKKRILDTYGDKWAYLQRHKFGANAQPFYVILDPDGNLLAGPYGYDENIDRFSRFLKQGIEEFSGASR